MSTKVDQGAPGNQGPWPVSVASSPTEPVIVENLLATTGGDLHFALTQATPVLLNTAAHSTSRTKLVTNNGPNPIFVGFSNVAATLEAEGQPVAAGASIEYGDIATTLNIYGVATVADQVSPADTRVQEIG